MRYNPYMRRRRLNSSTEPNWNVIADEAFRRIMMKKYRLGMADVADCKVDVYQVNGSPYIEISVTPADGFATQSYGGELAKLSELSIRSACEECADKLNKAIQAQFRRAIDYYFVCALEDRGQKAQTIEIGDVHRYEDWTYACDLNITVDGELYSDFLDFELSRRSIERAVEWFVNEINR